MIIINEKGENPTKYMNQFIDDLKLSTSMLVGFLHFIHFIGYVIIK